MIIICTKHNYYVMRQICGRERFTVSNQQVKFELLIHQPDRIISV